LKKNIDGKISVDTDGRFIFEPNSKGHLDNIEIGDIIAFKRSFIKDGDTIKASSLDNRIGCSILLEILEAAVKSTPANKLIFVFSAKEEIDQSSFKEIADIYKNAFAIVIDAAYAQPVDFDINIPGVSIPVLGNGCAVQTKGKGFIIPGNLVNTVKKIAANNNIKIQEESAPEGLGKTNFAKMLKQGINQGVVINVPVRDQHNQTAMANFSDVKEAVRLISIISSENMGSPDHII